MTNTRDVALGVLLKIEESKAYSNLELNHALQRNRLGGLDSAFVSALVYGVLERRLTLDYIIRQYSKIPLRKIELKTKIILRLGLYQLIFMDKVPDSAAVNESVILAKKYKLQKSAGFINGILRSVTRAEQRLLLPPEDDRIYYLSIKYSVPQAVVRLWLDSYGETNALELMEALFGRPEVCVRVNTLKTTPAELIKRLESEGVRAEQSALLPNALVLSGTGSIERLQSFREGLFHVQELSSQLCVDALSPKPRDIVADVCAAPGGKSFTAAQYMQNRGKLLSCDLYAQKVGLLETEARRLGISCLTALRRDGESGAALPQADKIICDVPCSGLGMLGRKPEIRYKDDLLDNDLPERQYRILCNSAKSLAVGGRLVYSTCTLNPAENNLLIERFLNGHPDFVGEALTLPEGVSRAFDEQPFELTLMPHTAGTDGFYIARLKRRSYSGS